MEVNTPKAKLNDLIFNGGSFDVTINVPALLICKGGVVAMDNC
jgi:hypothetical protein